MNVVGFVRINRNAKSGMGTDVKSFLGERVRVLEFNKEGDVLVVNNKGDALCMFDKEDVYQKFECKIYNNVICPPNLSFISLAAYHLKATQRKGGYNQVVANLVIECSLMKGKFDDTILWSKQ